LLMDRTTRVATILLLLGCTCTSASADNYSLLIKRKQKILQVLKRESAKPVAEYKIDIGRGGIKSKKTMHDEITPTGNFKVDLIVSDDERRNEISPQSKKRYTGKTYRQLVSDKKGLRRLFANMSSLDFDGNGKPDRAYGSAYIGLDSKSGITGPKLTRYKGTPYWYSIAIHGTPEGKIGKSSGGCIHVDKEALATLIEKYVKIDTAVRIED
jgi:hypothetical protein